MVSGWLPSLRRRWWAVVVVAVLGAAIGWASALWAAGAEAVSTTELVVTGRITEDRDSALTMNQYVAERMTTYVLVATSEVVRADAAVRGQTGPEAFTDTSVSVTNPPDTTALVLDVRADDPETARSRGQAFASAVIERVETLEQNRDGRTVVVTVESPPSLPEAGNAPPTALTVVAGAVLGAIVGLLAVVALGAGRERRSARARADEHDEFWSTYDDVPYGRPQQFVPLPSPTPAGRPETVDAPTIRHRRDEARD